MNIFDRIALLKLPFERFEYYAVDLPILVATNPACYLRLLDANMSNNGNGFVIASEIAKRRPLVFLSGQTYGPNEKNDAEFE